MDLQAQNLEFPVEDPRVRRAVSLLSEALGIIDELGAAPEAGARLEEVIAVVTKTS